MRGRIAEDDSSAPEKRGAYAYYWRMQAGQQYRIFCRRQAASDVEEILLDENALAEGKAYPNLYVKAGLNDLQAPYWDPAKYVAKLRANKSDTNRLVLVTNMCAGHHGSSRRYDHLREDAEVFAFLLDSVSR